MLLLEYKGNTDPQKKPFAPQYIFSQGILEETITDWYWNEDPLFKNGWLPKLRILNFQHPKITASIQNAHREQKEILNCRGYRYPHH